MRRSYPDRLLYIKEIKLKKSVFNSAKIAFGCVAAIALCSLLGLKYSLSAGLLTVLSIQDTKRETINTAVKRLCAFFCAFTIACICFNSIGYSTLAFGIYLFIFVNICIIMEWKIAIVPVSVLVTHLVSEQSTDIMLIINEFLLFTIGACTVILINMHLHSNTKKMSQCRKNLDEEIKAVLERMSARIITGDKTDYNGDCFKRIDSLMFEAQKTARENFDNKLMNPQTYDIEYLGMRKKQCSILYEMYRNILKTDTPPEQAGIISDFLKKISLEYHEQNDVKKLIGSLDEIFLRMQSQPMPRTRPEFQNRALLYSFMLLMKDFLLLKYEFICRINSDYDGKKKK